MSTVQGLPVSACPIELRSLPKVATMQHALLLAKIRSQELHLVHDALQGKPIQDGIRKTAYVANEITLAHVSGECIRSCWQSPGPDSALQILTTASRSIMQAIQIDRLGSSTTICTLDSANGSTCSAGLSSLRAKNSTTF
jgi:hypothetical protein